MKEIMYVVYVKRVKGKSVFVDAEWCNDIDEARYFARKIWRSIKDIEGYSNIEVSILIDDSEEGIDLYDIRSCKVVSVTGKFRA